MPQIMLAFSKPTLLDLGLSALGSNPVALLPGGGWGVGDGGGELPHKKDGILVILFRGYKCCFGTF